ncbi:peroxisomal nicotinamide adenine dinucleotide carrier-like isoform X1 [Arachis duranensis]|uniref:Peroxisomal nicotinamide adenine dinucleotide carrier-like isoform X1 n=1 Tax=Arachis duranensis TaxID=130453 RepID=A0A6P4BRC2_ARADU|nr:peroxisomal nicotinamide adenine dinucleotide carrier-like isoform X1 [Arachis duranensis]
MSDALINGLAGAGGGIISQLITYPLLTLNTRQQTDRDVKKIKSKVGTLDQMCQVVKEEGWERLYGGLIPSLVGTAASQGVYYYFYQIFRNRAEEAALTQKKIGISDGSVGMLSSLFIAALSGSLNVLLTNPIWVVVTRMQTQRKESNKKDPDMGLLIVGGEESVPLPADKPLPYDTKHVIQEVYEEGGILGFWNGVLPSLIMVCNPSIQFMLYETMLLKMKRPYGNKKGRNGVTAFEIFLLGALAKLGATVVTYPLLVLKSRLQAKQDKTGDNRHHYTGTWDAIVKMINYEGIYGFYKGMGTKIVQSVLAAAVLFMMKEELVKGVQSFLAKDGSNAVKRKQ